MREIESVGILSEGVEVPADAEDGASTVTTARFKPAKSVAARISMAMIVAFV